MAHGAALLPERGGLLPADLERVALSAVDATTALVNRSIDATLSAEPRASVGVLEPNAQINEASLAEELASYTREGLVTVPVDIPQAVDGSFVEYAVAPSQRADEWERSWVPGPPAPLPIRVAGRAERRGRGARSSS
jgi:hypothetical protein